jgi:hypothetical protein
MIAKKINEYQASFARLLNFLQTDYTSAVDKNEWGAIE